MALTRQQAWRRCRSRQRKTRPEPPRALACESPPPQPRDAAAFSSPRSLSVMTGDVAQLEAAPREAVPSPVPRAAPASAPPSEVLRRPSPYLRSASWQPETSSPAIRIGALFELRRQASVESVVDSAQRCARRRRRVSFHTVTRMVLVPLLHEYGGVGLKERLWYNCVDIAGFKRDAYLHFRRHGSLAAMDDEEEHIRAAEAEEAAAAAAAAAAEAAAGDAADGGDEWDGNEDEDEDDEEEEASESCEEGSDSGSEGEAEEEFQESSDLQSSDEKSSDVKLSDEPKPSAARTAAPAARLPLPPAAAVPPPSGLREVVEAAKKSDAAGAAFEVQATPPLTPEHSSGSSGGGGGGGSRRGGFRLGMRQTLPVMVG